MEEAMRTLWVGNISLSCVILMVLLGRLCLSRSPKIFSYALWFLVLVRIVCPFETDGVFTFFPDPVETEVGTAMESLQTPPEIFFPGKGWEQAEESRGRDVVQSVAESQTLNEKSGTKAEIETKTGFFRSITIYDVMFVLCVVVYLVLVMYLILSMFLVRKKLRDAIPIGNNIYKTDAVANSLVSGVFHPHIYVNPDICQSPRLDYILAHEQYHIRRRDYLIKPLAFFLVANWWFNPLVWLAYILMVRDMEMSCDEMVLRKLGLEARKEYSYLLLDMAAEREQAFCQNPAIGGRSVKRRIHNILRYKRPSSVMVFVSLLVVALCGCSLFSTPMAEQSAAPAAVTQETDGGNPYVEQKLDMELNPEMFGIVPKKDIRMNITPEMFQQDREGNMYILALLYDKVFNVDIRAVRFDGKNTETVALPWAEKLLKFAGQRKMCLSYAFFGQDGKFYTLFNEYNIDVMTVQRESAEPYVTKKHLFQVDFTGDAWKEIPLPEESRTGEREYSFSVSVFADGNLLLSGELIRTGIYSPTDGTRIRELEDDMSYFAGDGEYYSISQNPDGTEPLCTRIYDEQTGDMIRELSMEGILKGDGNNNVAYRYREGCMHIISDSGIFRAEQEDDEFTRVMDPESGQAFYLGDNKYVLLNLLVDDVQNYYTGFCEEKPSGEFEIHMCSYRRQQP